MKAGPKASVGGAVRADAGPGGGARPLGLRRGDHPAGAGAAQQLGDAAGGTPAPLAHPRPDPSLTGQPTLIEHLKSSDRAAQLEALKSLNKLRRVDEQSVMEEAPLNEFLMVELRWGLNMLRARDLLRDRLRRVACCGASCRRRSMRRSSGGADSFAARPEGTR